MKLSCEICNRMSSSIYKIKISHDLYGHGYIQVCSKECEWIAGYGLKYEKA